VEVDSAFYAVLILSVKPPFIYVINAPRREIQTKDEWVRTYVRTHTCCIQKGITRYMPGSKIVKDP